ncbi:hypothetical protein [Nostoc sp. 'Peltigera membranacea cyanobiont' N6]|uniref:hypothetical protein n=1 Tax=Nostoc sp. 'Peltigera membranacea cyanobiont' N6 TaxID=1261031 RepID=UPI000D0C345C|nr:hypothetical protein [Nostoc sp. 'Peltigera membranacea cyanobiont' N6]AVH63634.1 hypothetical protein NPM_1847 [Nostoc sp. 'Peltigera membranacea cyanobiont' N6]
MMAKPSSRRKKATSAAEINSKSLSNSANEDISVEENPATATITVSAVEVEELTDEEQSDRLHLERKVEKAVFEAGKALMELRDRRLYRSTHSTFEEYCKDRFGFQRRHPYRLIEASAVFDNLMKMCPKGTQTETETETESSDAEIYPSGTQTENEEMCPIGTQILPTSERQVRPITKLEPQQQWEVWQRAVEEAGGKVPSARVVGDVVQRIMERTKVPNTYQLGEVCQILAKDNPELRGKGGCWVIVSQVNEFSCTVKTWNGEYTVGLQHLKSYNYLPAECEQMQVICDRISRVYSGALEESVQKFLESLGKLNRAYLTDLEEKVLSLLELEIIP